MPHHGIICPCGCKGESLEVSLLKLSGRFFHAAMLQQPRVPATGQRQAIEIHIKWREVLAQKKIMLKILSRHTGHSMRKLDAVCSASHALVPASAGCCHMPLGAFDDMYTVCVSSASGHQNTKSNAELTKASSPVKDWQRPLYMQPEDAIEYGVAGRHQLCVLGKVVVSLTHAPARHFLCIG